MRKRAGGKANARFGGQTLMWRLLLALSRGSTKHAKHAEEVPVSSLFDAYYRSCNLTYAVASAGGSRALRALWRKGMVDFKVGGRWVPYPGAGNRRPVVMASEWFAVGGRGGVNAKLHGNVVVDGGMRYMRPAMVRVNKAWERADDIARPMNVSCDRGGRLAS